jgi:hypothetical protein
MDLMRIKPQTKDTRNYPKYAVGGPVDLSDPDTKTHQLTLDRRAGEMELEAMRPEVLDQQTDKGYETLPEDKDDNDEGEA